MALIGYARVSAREQDPALQLDALAYVRDGDVLVVWKLDRLGRSMGHPIETMQDLERRGRRAGRRPAVTPDKLRRADGLIAQGLTVREAAARLKVGKTALYAALARRRTDGA